MQPLPPDLVVPDYEDHGLSAVPGSIRRLFGLTAPRSLPEIPNARFDCVILVVVDALGWQQLEQHRAVVPAAERLVQRGQLLRITSVLPSSTVAALTTLFSGLTPQEHGMLGHTLYLREYALLADMLRFHPAWLPGREGLTRGETPPRELFPVPTLFEALAAEGIATRALMRRDYLHTALSQIHLAGAGLVPITAASDLCVTLRRLVETAPRPLFISAYWDALDGIAHAHGPGSAEEGAELGSFCSLLETEFLERLSAPARRGTLVLLTADHGQIVASETQAVHLNAHPEIREELLLPPAGDRRTAYLYARAGRIDRLRAAFAPLTDRFWLIDSADALAGGLFGRGSLNPEAGVRVGDLVVLARGGATLIAPEKTPPTTLLRGRHGGATPGEMYVPLLLLTP